ncbi:MAG: hypothetical protein AAYR33_02060 [Acetobacteraceae bacterium]
MKFSRGKIGNGLRVCDQRAEIMQSLRRHGHDGIDAKAKRGQQSRDKADAVRHLDQDTIAFFQPRILKGASQTINAMVQSGVSHAFIAMHQCDAGPPFTRPLCQHLTDWRFEGDAVDCKRPCGMGEIVIRLVKHGQHPPS